MPDGGGGADSRAAGFELEDIRFRRSVARLCRLGSRLVAAVLEELAGRYLIRLAVEQTVERYIAQVDSRALALTGGDRLPATPIHLVREWPP
jgi:hypothetical protein